MANNEAYIGQHLNMDGDEIRRLALEKITSFSAEAGIGEISFNPLTGQIQYVYKIEDGEKTIKTLSPLKLGELENILVLNNNVNGDTIISINLNVLAASIIKDNQTTDTTTWSSTRIEGRVSELVNILGDSLGDNINSQVALAIAAIGVYTSISDGPPSTSPQEGWTHLQVDTVTGQLTMHGVVNLEQDPNETPVWDWSVLWNTPEPASPKSFKSLITISGLTIIDWESLATDYQGNPTSKTYLETYGPYANIVTYISDGTDEVLQPIQVKRLANGNYEIDATGLTDVKVIIT